jgi:hypothetical protein
MGGFDNGGFGDDTGWSSETKDDGSEPGGGDNGHSGDHDNSGNSGGDGGGAYAAQKQMSDVQNDPQFRKKTLEIIEAARAFNPEATFTQMDLDAQGNMQVAVLGINREQGKQIGLVGGVISYDGGVVGEIRTGHALSNSDNSTVNNGQTGNWSRRGTGSGDDSVNVFVPVGPSEAEKKAAALSKSDYDKKLAEATQKADDLNEAQKAKEAEDRKRQETIRIQEDEEDSLKNAVKFTANFYKETFERFGENAKAIASDLADASKGKQLRNAQEALDAFNKFGDAVNQKYGVKDRTAIANALESLSKEEMAKNMAKFSKSFFVTGILIDANDLRIELQKAIETEQWRPFFVKIETLLAGAGATALTAWAFSMILGAPLGIVGFALVIAIVSAMVDDKLMGRVNNLLSL